MVRGMARDLVVKVTCGVEAPERCNQGFTVAATAAAAGSAVSLWLTGDAAWLAVPGRADELALPLATPIDQLLTAVLAAGSVTVCAQCAGRRDLGEGDLIPGVRIAGAAVFVDEVTRDGVQALVY
jgi:predicted peroxiredoxin